MNKLNKLYGMDGRMDGMKKSDDEKDVKDEKKTNIRLGLCCINNTLRKKNIFCSRTMIRKNFTVEKAQDLALKNCQDLIKLIQWNEENGIKHLRVSSDMFPHFTDSECEEYSLDFAKDVLAEAGDLARKYGHEITTHPGQYNQVGAISRDVFESTVKDLKMHADILDMMGYERGVICIHGGGTYGDKSATVRRWTEQFDELPRTVKNKLAIENCERQYSVVDCLGLAEDCGIPTIFDTHHYSCYCHIHGDGSDPFQTSQLSNQDEEILVEEFLPEILDSWGDRRPLFHISEQAQGKKIGAHSDYIESIPSYLLDIDREISIEVEAKQKESAIFKLYETYPELV